MPRRHLQVRRSTPGARASTRGHIRLRHQRNGARTRTSPIYATWGIRALGYLVDFVIFVVITRGPDTS